MEHRCVFPIDFCAYFTNEVIEEGTVIEQLKKAAYRRAGL